MRRLGRDHELQNQTKRENTYKCDTCNVKLVQLNRCFGGWPTEEFRQVDAAKQQQFMRDAAKTSSSTELRAWAAKFLSSYEIHSEHYAEQGEYLPLKVWSTRGFDATAIEQKSLPCNKRSLYI